MFSFRSNSYSYLLNLGPLDLEQGCSIAYSFKTIVIKSGPNLTNLGQDLIRFANLAQTLLFLATFANLVQIFLFLAPFTELAQSLLLLFRFVNLAKNLLILGHIGLELWIWSKLEDEDLQLWTRLHYSWCFKNLGQPLLFLVRLANVDKTIIIFRQICLDLQISCVEKTSPMLR